MFSTFYRTKFMWCINCIAVEAAIWLIASHRIASLFISSINLKEDTINCIHTEIDRHTHTHTHTHGFSHSHSRIHASLRISCNNNTHQWHWVSNCSVLFASYCDTKRLTSFVGQKKKKKEEKNIHKRVCAHKYTSVCKSRSSQCVILSVSLFHFYVVLLLFARLEWAIRQWWIHTKAKRIANHFTVCKVKKKK